MARAPFQVLVLPYRHSTTGSFEFAVFAPNDYPEWQGIAGGGEDDETPLAAAQRESWEEARIPKDWRYVQLDSCCSIPIYHFRDHHLWGDEIYVIPEYSFGIDVGQHAIELSDEHKEFRWMTYDEAFHCLTYDNNKTALWELHQRLLRNDLRRRSA